jgi:hypothetical protein
MADGCLWCDSEIARRSPSGTPIGLNHIKNRRLDLPLTCHASLHVGECVPFYFCPRSVMLYLIFRANHPELAFREGQTSIVHLEADLFNTVAWAQQNGKRWAFTLSNPGAYYFEDRCSLTQLNEINWDAVQSDQWGGIGILQKIKEGKQAEFLVEHSFPWFLVKRIGVISTEIHRQVSNIVAVGGHYPKIEVKRDWYY